jgi:hypothetical protein
MTFRNLIRSVAVAAALIASPALAQSIPTPHSSAGAGQYGVAITSATALTVPAFATQAKICVEGQPARWRDDGTAPTALVGMTAAIGCFDYAGPLAAFQIIQTAVSATIDVTYYR